MNIICSTDVVYKQQHFREQHKPSAITGSVFTEKRNFGFVTQQAANTQTAVVTIKLLGRQTWMTRDAMYEACPESKDTSRVSRLGNFLCLLWQHCRRP